jgi:hypothetical protein
MVWGSVSLVNRSIDQALIAHEQGAKIDKATPKLTKHGVEILEWLAGKSGNIDHASVLAAPLVAGIRRDRFFVADSQNEVLGTGKRADRDKFFQQKRAAEAVAFFRGRFHTSLYSVH